MSPVIKPTEKEYLTAYRRIRVDPEAILISRDDVETVVRLIANALAAQRIEEAS